MSSASPWWQSDEYDNVWLSSEDADDEDDTFSVAEDDGQKFMFVLPLNIVFLSVGSSVCGAVVGHALGCCCGIAHLAPLWAAVVAIAAGDAIGKVPCTIIGLDLWLIVPCVLKSTDALFTLVVADDVFARKNFNLSSRKFDEVFRILSFLH